MSPGAIATAMTMTTPLVYLDPEVPAAATAQFSGTIITYSAWSVPLFQRVLYLAQRRPAEVTPGVAERAIYLIHQLAAFGLDLESFRPPFIGPVSEGGIIFEWTVGNRELSLALLPEGTTQYLKWEASEQFEEDVLPARAPGRLRELIAWVTSSTGT
jgi:hypothetical protein